MTDAHMGGSHSGDTSDDLVFTEQDFLEGLEIAFGIPFGDTRPWLDVMLDHTVDDAPSGTFVDIVTGELIQEHGGGGRAE